MKPKSPSKDLNIITITINYPGLRVEKPNIYIVKKSFGYAMIDCGGFDPENDFDNLYNELRSHKIELQDIKHVFLTHTHKDHSFLSSKIQALTGAKIYLGRDDYPRISNSFEDYRKNFIRIKEYLRYWGFDDSMFSRFCRSFERQYYNCSLNLNKTVIIDSDLEIDSLKLINSPGHTSGSVCIYDKELKVLFTGDTILKKIVLVPVIEYDRGQETGLSMLSRHTDSLRALSNLDYDSILPGHGGVIPREFKIIDAVLSYIERRSKRVLSLVLAGKNTVYDIAESLYSKGTLEDVVFKDAPLVYVSDLMMPLENLLRNGKIEVKDGIIKPK
ncbi:MAG: MBL fold metallo-hydrolase [Deltaproteobacteria bacterium]|nr:MBL fold metallo-hydrolase [Deltaproteobacteria bacterium]